MGNPESLKDAVTFIKMFRELWDEVKRLSPLFSDWVTSKSTSDVDDVKSLPRVLIIGPGGVGKSTLGRFISGAAPRLTTDETRYVESLDVEEYALASPAAEFVVPPGQKNRRDWAWNELERGLVEGVFDGVMLVMAYGFHSIGDVSWQSLARSSEANDIDRFLAGYLGRCRNDEIAVAERLAQSIKLTPQPLWVLTVVAKEDLWFESRPEVHRHYRDGDYGRALTRALSGSSCTHRVEVAFGCLAQLNFSTGQNELLAKTTAGYDWPQFADSWKRLWHAIAAMSDTESKS